MPPDSTHTEAQQQHRSRLRTARADRPAFEQAPGTFRLRLSHSSGRAPGRAQSSPALCRHSWRLPDTVCATVLTRQAPGRALRARLSRRVPDRPELLVPERESDAKELRSSAAPGSQSAARSSPLPGYRELGLSSGAFMRVLYRRTFAASQPGIRPSPAAFSAPSSRRLRCSAPRCPRWRPSSAPAPEPPSFRSPTLPPSWD